MATPGSRAKLETLITNKARGMSLVDGSDCIAMLVTEAPAELLIAAFSLSGTKVAPTIKIDRVALDRVAPDRVAPTSQTSVAASAAQTRAQAAPSIPQKGLSILASLEKQGDKLALPGELAGDINADLRLEGFQVHWPDRPEGVDLAYGVVVDGLGAMPVVSSGNFSGTRHQGKRITEVTLALVGPKAQRYQLSGRACFSGGFQLPIHSGFPLSGPSGMEHLTGLCVNIVEQGDAVRSSKARAVKPSAPAAGSSASKKVTSKPVSARSEVRKAVKPV